MLQKNIAIIGCGNMGGALAAGCVSRKVINPTSIAIYDPAVHKTNKLSEDLGVISCETIAHAVKTADIIVVAVKPSIVREVLWSISEILLCPKDLRTKDLGTQPLVISVAAGVSTKEMSKILGDSWPLVRVMPNLPCLHGVGMSAYYLTPSAIVDSSNSAAPDLELANVGNNEVYTLLSALGRVIRVDSEELLSAVTGLSGSGPAFAFAIMEALADGGVKMGLPRNSAQMLAAQTLLGAAHMLINSNLHSAELKDMVASPGGTTISGLHVLESGGLRGLLMSAVEASANKACQLDNL